MMQMSKESDQISSEGPRINTEVKTQSGKFVSHCKIVVTASEVVNKTK
jgi:hypothetical protein